MKPMRPYLLRALYDWMIDNGYTPHLIVDATLPGVEVPLDLVHEGRITLNIHPNAVQGFHMGEDVLRFAARFGGVPRPIVVPMPAVLGAVARETGRGLFFENEEFGAPDPTPEPPSTPAPEKTRKPGPSLRVVK